MSGADRLPVRGERRRLTFDVWVSSSHLWLWRGFAARTSGTGTGPAEAKKKGRFLFVWFFLILIKTPFHRSLNDDDEQNTTASFRPRIPPQKHERVRSKVIHFELRYLRFHIFILAFVCLRVSESVAVVRKIIFSL